MTRASAALAPESSNTGVLFHGMVGAGKTACAVELAYHFRQTGRFNGWVWFKAPDQGRDISTTLRDLALAMEAQLPGFTMMHVVGRQDELTQWLPRLKTVLEDNAIFFMLDNLELLLTAACEWRDPQFGQVVGALVGHQGLSRTVLTSRIRPANLPASVLCEPINALSLAEAALLMSEPPRLYRLLHGGVEERTLARRLLNVVQGLTKLIELAEGMAENYHVLEAQVERAERAWQAGSNPLSAFFRSGRSDISDEGFLGALANWSAGATAVLPKASRFFFYFLCMIEEGDREDRIIDAVWSEIWFRVHPSEAPLPSIAEVFAPSARRLLSKQ